MNKLEFNSTLRKDGLDGDHSYISCLSEMDIERQKEFSIKTFGPGPRAEGVVDHIRKELFEILEQPNKLDEWADVIILAIDGAWREGYEPWEIINAYHKKMEINQQRQWPDWRTAEPGKAIEHIRG